MRFFVELRRRGVLKIATGYLVVSWLTLEIGHTLFNVFELPHAGLQFVFVLLALGFPLALLGAWQGWFGSALLGDAHPAHTAAEDHPTTSHHEGPWLAGVFGAVAIFAVAVAIGVRFFGMGHPVHGEAEAVVPAASAPAPAVAPAVFSPPARSIAVLPFVNMSGDPRQDYFSDGMSEELLNSLVTIRDLQVAARTSSFFFKGKDVDLVEVAHKLNVGSVLEGSVRKDGNHVRITAQLINAVTGFHLWSQTYDRDLKNILALQTEIASAVTKSLQATLLADAATGIELGGTQNPQAFDAYLRGEKLRDGSGRESKQGAIDAYGEAIREDPKFAKAYVGEAFTQSSFAGSYASASEKRAMYEQALATAQKALALAPELGSAHAAKGAILRNGFFEFSGAILETDRALALSPGDIRVIEEAVRTYGFLGRGELAESTAQRAVALDPLNAHAYLSIGISMYFSRKYRKSIEALERANTLEPGIDGVNAFRGLAHAYLGELEAAHEACATAPLSLYNHVCLAIVQHKMGRQAQAQAEFDGMRKDTGDGGAYQYAEVYAQWGDLPKALDWLDTAYRLRDPGLTAVKGDALMDPLRKEPRFQEIERKLKFPA